MDDRFATQAQGVLETNEKHSRQTQTDVADRTREELTPSGARGSAQGVLQSNCNGKKKILEQVSRELGRPVAGISPLPQRQKNVQGPTVRIDPRPGHANPCQRFPGRSGSQVVPSSPTGSIRRRTRTSPPGAMEHTPSQVRSRALGAPNLRTRSTPGDPADPSQQSSWTRRHLPQCLQEMCIPVSPQHSSLVQPLHPRAESPQMLEGGRGDPLAQSRPTKQRPGHGCRLQSGGPLPRHSKDIRTCNPSSTTTIPLGTTNGTLETTWLHSFPQLLHRLGRPHRRPTRISRSPENGRRSLSGCQGRIRQSPSSALNCSTHRSRNASRTD